jgi:hypothetical protein
MVVRGRVSRHLCNPVRLIFLSQRLRQPLHVPVELDHFTQYSGTLRAAASHIRQDFEQRRLEADEGVIRRGIFSTTAFDEAGDFLERFARTLENLQGQFEWDLIERTKHTSLCFDATSWLYLTSSFCAATRLRCRRTSRSSCCSWSLYLLAARIRVWRLTKFSMVSV